MARKKTSTKKKRVVSRRPRVTKTTKRANKKATRQPPKVSKSEQTKIVKARQARVASKKPASPWSWWATLFDRLPGWMVSPEPDSVPEAPPRPYTYDAVSIGEWEIAKENYDNQLKRRPIVHEETSKTIRWIFRTLIGVCLFCVITLAGSPDIQLLVPDAMVEMPIINYELSFVVFLVIGPVIVLGLTIYLHVFVAHHRKWPVEVEDRTPFIFNMRGVAPNLITWILFYWVVPLTLAFFTWKALPRPLEGSVLFLGTLAVTAGLVWLQIRRCRHFWRPWAVPLLLVLFGGLVALGIYAAAEGPPINRTLNLFKADLASKDLRRLNLSGPFLQEAKLEKANLLKANLLKADLGEAFLRGADLRGALLFGADLGRANLDRANLGEADLRKANLNSANLTRANLTRANLGLAFLREANLNSANLTRADLTDAQLQGANLGNANLRKANLDRANLRGANLSNTLGLQEKQLEAACGSNNLTVFPSGMAGLTTKPCRRMRKYRIRTQ